MTSPGTDHGHSFRNTKAFCPPGKTISTAIPSPVARVDCTYEERDFLDDYMAMIFGNLACGAS